MKRSLTALLLSLLLPVLILCSCISPAGTSPEQSSRDFHSFAEELFCAQAGSDAISLNYTLAHPEAYGLSADRLSLGHISLSDLQGSLVRSENILARLKQFSRRELSDSERLLYDSIAYAYRSDELPPQALACCEILSPTIGIQAQLPVLLAEYNFYTEEDLDRYLQLLLQVLPYFEEILVFEQEKAAAGTFMSDAMASEVIAGMEAFIEKPEQNLLLSSFENVLARFPELSEEQKEEYRHRNEDAVHTGVIPAYELLIRGLKELKGSGVNDFGLYYLEGGKEYYEASATARIGTGKSIPQVKELLEGRLEKALAVIQGAASRSPDIRSQITGFTYSQSDPEQILNTLNKTISGRFPSCQDIAWEVSRVDPSLAEYASPAFYLTPPLDTGEHVNHIYINPSAGYSSAGLFTTLAHEGFPGHMYQNIMARRSGCDPLQILLSPGGYSEGWATYAEYLSWQWLGLPEDASLILAENQIATLCVYGLTDIGIHYEGWTLETAAAFLGRYGITDTQITGQLYNRIAWTPGNYLQYIGGFCEFMELRSRAETLWENDFSELRFHTFLMEAGPAPFDSLADLLEKTELSKSKIFIKSE